MYDAVTRTTYAELFKTAEAKAPERLHTALVKVAAHNPVVRDALARTPTANNSQITTEKR